MISFQGNNEEEPGDFDPSTDGRRGSFQAELLDTFSAALCLVDDALHVIASNVAAQTYLGERGGDALLRLLNQAINGKPHQLRKQVRDAVAAGERAVLMLQTAAHPPLICNVQAVAQQPAARALVALTPLTGGSHKVVPYLRSLYKLSNAEAEIAAAAAAGMDIFELAQSRQVSINTLRAQIAAVKAKMGLSRMTEIAVTVGRIEAAVTWL